MGRALLTDLYELRMAASYRRRAMDGPATFSLFVRALPPDRGFLVACGLEDCVRYLEGLAVGDDDLEAFAAVGLDAATVDSLAGLRFSGEVWAVPEGRIVYADEPLLEVTAPIAEAQLVETALLNQLTFQTAVASKAARCRLAAGEAGLVDFAFRRTHGVEAAMAVARATAIVGFSATSNVAAAQRFGLRASGTMAHSYVEAFTSEVEAFRAFATDNPESATLLVDTYDVARGVQAAIEVILELGLGEQAAIRIDSGDLGTLAVEARKLLDGAGLTSTRIFASVGGQPFGLRRRVRPLPIHLTPGAIREDRAPSGASHADVRRSASQHRHDLLLRGSDHVRQQGQPDLRRRAVQDAVHLLVLTGLRRIRSQCAIRRTPALLCRPSPAGPARPRAGTSCSHPLMGPGSPGTVRPHSNPAGPGS